MCRAIQAGLESLCCSGCAVHLKPAALPGGLDTSLN